MLLERDAHQMLPTLVWGLEFCRESPESYLEGMRGELPHMDGYPASIEP